MPNKIPLLILTVLLSMTIVFCQDDAINEPFSLIFETEFEYLLEDPEMVNFNQTLDLNGVDRAEIHAKLWKQNLTQYHQPELYLANILKQGIHADSVYKIDINPSWMAQSTGKNEALFTTVDTTVNIAETATIHASMRSWTNYKIKQRWYYHESSRRISNEVLSISPIFITKKTTASYPNPDTIIFNKEERIKVHLDGGLQTNSTKKALYDDQDIIWMMQIKTDVSFDHVKIIKGSKAKFKQIFWEDIISFRKTAFTKKINLRTATDVPFGEFALEEMMSSSIDTIIVFDPSTYEEKVAIAEYIPPTFEAIRAYSINQVWYFNGKTNQLNSTLISIAPLVKGHFNQRLKELYFIEQHQ